MDDAVKRWAEMRAAERHDGDVLAFVEAVLRAEMAAEQAPGDAWARAATRATAGKWPPYRVPVPALVAFIHDYDPKRDGEHATDVLAAMRTRLGMPPG